MPQRFEQEVIDSVDLDWASKSPTSITSRIEARFQDWVNRVNLNPGIVDSDEIRILEGVSIGKDEVDSKETGILFRTGYDSGGNAEVSPGIYGFYRHTYFVSSNGSLNFRSLSEYGTTVSPTSGSNYLRPDTSYALSGFGRISSSTISSATPTYIHFVECDNEGEEFFSFGYGQSSSTNLNHGFGIFRTTSGHWYLEGHGRTHGDSNSRLGTAVFDWVNGVWSYDTWEAITNSDDSMNRPILHVDSRLGTIPAVTSWGAWSIEMASPLLSNMQQRAIGTRISSEFTELGLYYVCISPRGLWYEYNPSDLS